MYSSGAGIALGLIVRHFLGPELEATLSSVDPVIPRALDGLRVADRRCSAARSKCSTEIGRAGCGVTSIVLNGVAVRSRARPNPHRRGAALVAHSALLPKLSAKENVLVIELG